MEAANNTTTAPMQQDPRFEPCDDPTKVPVPIVNAIILPLNPRIITLISSDNQRFSIHADKAVGTSETLKELEEINKEMDTNCSEYPLDIKSDVLRYIVEFMSYKYKWFLNIHVRTPDFVFPPKMKNSLLLAATILKI